MLHACPMHALSSSRHAVSLAQAYATQRSARPLARRRLVVAAAMFDQLSLKLQDAWKNIAPDARLTAENMKAPLKDIRRWG